MVTIFERLRKGGQVLKLRFREAKEKQALKSEFQRELREIKQEQRQKALEERTRKEIAKQDRITEVRQAQLRRASTEAKILQAKAKRVKAQRIISGQPQGFGPSQAIGQVKKGFERAARAPPRPIGARPPGAVLLDMGPQSNVRVRPPQLSRRKRKRVQVPVPQRGPTPGLGRFRVL